MKDLDFVVDASTYVRIERAASELKISVAEWLALFFENAGCPNLNFTSSGCPNLAKEGK
jgi:hypothetical protein